MADDASPTTTTAPAAPDGDRDGSERRQRKPRWSVLPWLVAAVALLVAAAATSAWLDLRGEAQARDEVQRAAEEFLVALTTWDASDGLEDTQEQLRSLGTGSFLSEVDQVFGEGRDIEQAVEVEATSTGEVEDVFVQRLQDDQAEVFGVVVKEVRTNLAEDVEESVVYARLQLVREDGAWLVSEVDLVLAQPDAPEVSP